MSFPRRSHLPGTVLQVPTTTAIAIPLLQNGRKATSALIYDLSYKASYHSQIWGTQAKLVLDMGPNHDGMTLKPIVGFRYLNFDEQFRQTGVTSFASNIVRGPALFTGIRPLFLPVGQSGTLKGPLRTSIIDSQAENNLFGLQLGTRAEFQYKRLTLGVDPRISLGVNHYETEVTTTNLRSLADGRHRTRKDDLIFAPVFDVSMYGRFEGHALLLAVWGLQLYLPLPRDAADRQHRVQRQRPRAAARSGRESPNRRRQHPRSDRGRRVPLPRPEIPLSLFCKPILQRHGTAPAVPRLFFFAAVWERSAPMTCEHRRRFLPATG